MSDSLVVQQEKKEYQLLPGYPDPFLKYHTIKKAAVQKPNEQKSQANRRVSRRRRIATARWPEIKFGGIITNGPSDKVTILVEIDKSKCLMNVGDVRKGVEVKKYFPDSIIVAYKGEQKTIPK